MESSRLPCCASAAVALASWLASASLAAVAACVWKTAVNAAIVLACACCAATSWLSDAVWDCASAARPESSCSVSSVLFSARPESATSRERARTAPPRAGSSTTSAPKALLTNVDPLADRDTGKAVAAQAQASSARMTRRGIYVGLE